MVAHENLLCHLKSNSQILINGFYLLSSLGWMKKTMIDVFKIGVHFKHMPEIS
jgi:hypothetical protein